MTQRFQWRRLLPKSGLWRRPRERRERAEAEARGWDEAKIREEAERTRADAGANTKAET